MMGQTYHIHGTLHFDPRPTGKGRKGRRAHGWCVLSVDPALVHYLHWHVAAAHTLPLKRPAWPGVVPVVLGATPRRGADLWGAREGASVSLVVRRIFTEDVGRWWCPVECPEMRQLREALGLSPLPRGGFRLCVAEPAPSRPG